MRSIVTAIAFGVLILSAFALYAITYDASRLSTEVAGLTEKVAADEEEIAELRAEKANLMRPSRIDRLVKVNLKLRPLRPGQLGRIADLPWRGEPGGTAADTPPLVLKP